MRNIGTIVGIVYLALLIGGLYGWAANIATLCNSNLDHITGMLVCRIIGVLVAPVGAVMGYL